MIYLNWLVKKMAYELLLDYVLLLSLIIFGIFIY